MAIQVDFKNPIGYYTTKWSGKSYKNEICPMNGLCAMIHTYDHPVHGTTIELRGFFGDIEHAKKCIEKRYFSNCSGLTFYAKALTKDLWKMIQIMTKNGIKVTIK